LLDLASGGLSQRLEQEDDDNGGDDDDVDDEHDEDCTKKFQS
jgi:hypothetical protein